MWHGVHLYTQNKNRGKPKNSRLSMRQDLLGSRRPKVWGSCFSYRNDCTECMDFLCCITASAETTCTLTSIKWPISELEESNVIIVRWFYKLSKEHSLTFRHRASSIQWQAFHYSPENAFYIFNQQIYFIIWYLLDRASLI